MDSNKVSVFAAIRGPIMLIALGGLFTMDEFTDYSFWRTWPALLILFGVLKLLEKIFSGESQRREYVPPGAAS